MWLCRYHYVSVQEKLQLESEAAVVKADVNAPDWYAWTIEAAAPEADPNNPQSNLSAAGAQQVWAANPTTSNWSKLRAHAAKWTNARIFIARAKERRAQNVEMSNLAIRMLESSSDSDS